MKTYKCRIDKLISYITWVIVTFGFFCICITIILRNGFEKSEMLTIALCLILLLVVIAPYFLVASTYLITDLNKKIIFDKDEIIVCKNNKQIVFKRNDIKCFYNVKASEWIGGSRNMLRGCEYFLIILNSMTRIYFTNIICQTNELLSSIKLTPIVIEDWFPFIDRSIGRGFLDNAEYMEKVKEFEDKYSSFSESELQNGYSGDADPLLRSY